MRVLRCRRVQYSRLERLAGMNAGQVASCFGYDCVILAHIVFGRHPRLALFNNGSLHYE